MTIVGPFVLITVTLVLTSAIMVLFPTAWITDVMQLVHIPFSFRVLIVVMAGLNLGLSLVCEGWVFPRFAKLIGEWWGSRKAKKEAKYQQEREIFAPTPSQSVGGGYGSQDLTQRTGQQGQSVGIDIDGGATAGADAAVAGQSVPKKTLKKSSIKIYKMVEDEMTGA